VGLLPLMLFPQIALYLQGLAFGFASASTRSVLARRRSACWSGSAHRRPPDERCRHPFEDAGAWSPPCRTAFVAALRQDGLTAPWAFDGPINAARFLAQVEQAVAPTLRTGDLVVMDNLPAHKVQGVRQAIAERGAPQPDLAPGRQRRPSMSAWSGAPIEQASRPCCEPSIPSGMPSAGRSTPSHLPNPPATSPTTGYRPPYRNML
jgi:hypothetical protein